MCLLKAQPCELQVLLPPAVEPPRTDSAFAPSQEHSIVSGGDEEIKTVGRFLGRNATERVAHGTKGNARVELERWMKPDCLRD